MLELVHRKSQSLEYKPQKIGNKEKLAKREKAMSELIRKIPRMSARNARETRRIKRGKSGALSNGSDTD